MSLTSEWQRRVDHWRRELRTHFYRPLGNLALTGLVTTEPLTPEAARSHTFRPMPPGTRWGAKWEYGWFHGEIVLPDNAAGQRIALRLDIGAEGLVFVNGSAAGAVDREHGELTLTTSGVPGMCYDVLVEAYAGHGPLVVGGGPVAYGQPSVPEPPPTQATIGDSTFGIWNEEAYQLWLDAETLFRLRESLDPDSLRVAEIDAGLRDFTLLVDLELPPDELLPALRAGRERLAPLLAAVNGTTAPILFAVGHAHLDVAWLWPLAETRRKIGRTVANQLALMAEYGEYRYLQSQPQLYAMLREHYPELYDRVVAAVQAGQFIPEGGMWLEADTNLTGGESLIRQIMHGKRFFRQEFGVESELLWLPDVFGYSAALPQIMAGCGLKYFATSKIFWAYNGGEPFPYNTFTWQGSDGSTVLAQLFNDYNSETHPAALIQRWRERVQKDGVATMLVAFGHGDGGGGPTRDHIEFLRRARDLEGAPRTRIYSPVQFFHDLEARGAPRERYVGELYFQAHRGTYTSQARIKQLNRRAELALREADLWSAVAPLAASIIRHPSSIVDCPSSAMDAAWRTLLLHQFHDILPGSSIHRVYKEAEASLAGVIATAQEVACTAEEAVIQEESRTQSLQCGTDDALTLFNSLSWARTALAALPEGWAGAMGLAGQPLPAQEIAGRVWVEAVLPPCGWTTLRRAISGKKPVVEGTTLRITERLLENEYLRLAFNDLGEIVSIADKDSGQELTAGPCNSFKMYRDVPGCFDAWDIDSMYEDSPVALDSPATVEIVAAGPLVATLRITRRLHDSALTQEISLRRGSRRVDFATTIDWQERHKLLKVAFPVTIHADEALHEIQFGHIRRPTHRSRPADAARFEVVNHKWSALVEERRGIAVLNDCKYGLNVLQNPPGTPGASINLTLLKSALAPDMTADLGKQVFTYAFYAWNGDLYESGVVREGYELNVPVTTCAGAAGERSFFVVDVPNVIIETVKPAEDGSGDVVVRLYEAVRTATRCTLAMSLPAAAATRTDMLERPIAELPCTDGRIPLDFWPFEIKTLRLRLV